MGAWGVGNFENDDAQDWMLEFVVGGDPNDLIEPLSVEAGEYLEAPDACIALAAAEVVAALLGRPSLELPEDLRNWVVARPKASPSLVNAARNAVAVVAQDSELAELWEEAEDDLDAWRAQLVDLAGRLNAA